MERSAARIALHTLLTVALADELCPDAVLLSPLGSRQSLNDARDLPDVSFSVKRETLDRLQLHYDDNDASEAHDNASVLGESDRGYSFRDDTQTMTAALQLDAEHVQVAASDMNVDVFLSLGTAEEAVIP